MGETPDLSFLVPLTSTPLAPALTHLGLRALLKCGTPGEGTPTAPSIANPSRGGPRRKRAALT